MCILNLVFTRRKHKHNDRDKRSNKKKQRSVQRKHRHKHKHEHKHKRKTEPKTKDISKENHFALTLKVIALPSFVFLLVLMLRLATSENQALMCKMCTSRGRLYKNLVKVNYS